MTTDSKPTESPDSNFTGILQTYFWPLARIYKFLRGPIYAKVTGLLVFSGLTVAIGPNVIQSIVEDVVVQAYQKYQPNFVAPPQLLAPLLGLTLIGVGLIFLVTGSWFELRKIRIATDAELKKLLLQNRSQADDPIFKKTVQDAVRDEIAGLPKGSSSRAGNLLARHREQADYVEAAISKINEGVLAFADDSIKSVELFAEATRLNPDNPEGWYFLANSLHEQHRIEEAMHAYERLRDISADDDQWLARTFSGLGQIYESQGELDLAEEMQRAAFSKSAICGDKAGQADAKGNLGIILRKKGRWEHSLDATNESLNLNQKLDRPLSVAACYSNIGALFIDLTDATNFDAAQSVSDLEESGRAYTESLKLYNRLGVKRGTASALLNLGSVFGRLQEWTSALKHLHKALELNTELNRPREIAKTYLNIASVHALSGDREDARSSYLQAQRLFSDLGDDKSAEAVAGALENLNSI